MALLEADVALPVVKDFIEAVRGKALGQEVISSLSPGQALVKVVNDELVAIMGESQSSIDLNRKPPVIVLMAGLQGAGKTTTVAKLARRFREKDKKSVMVTSADVYRPAAIEQLQYPGRGSRRRFPRKQQRSETGRDRARRGGRGGTFRRRGADRRYRGSAGHRSADDGRNSRHPRCHRSG